MTLPNAAPDATNDPVLARLAAERAALLECVAQVPADRIGERSDADRWSVAELLEHLALVDTGVAKLIALRCATPAPAAEDQVAEARQREALLGATRDRSRRIEAPDRVRPSGSLSAEAARKFLDGARVRLVEAYRTAPAAVLDGMVHPHPVFGPLTLRGWVEFSAHHDARHAEQIAEVASQWREQRGE